MLETALDYGITEQEFWQMTFAEIERAAKSKRRCKLIAAQEKASFDYNLAGLIIKGVSKVMGDKSTYPTMEEAYPGIFDNLVEEQAAQRQAKKMELSALRFKQFAKSFNSNLKTKEVAKDNL
jgi:hypothetical protein